MPEVAEVRRRGFMVGIDLGEHDPALRMGHRVTLEARERGAIVRPLGNTVVLVPPLSISAEELARAARRSPPTRSSPPSPSRRAGDPAWPQSPRAPTPPETLSSQILAVMDRLSRP